MKTRLAKTLGDSAAAETFKTLVLAQLKRLPKSFDLEVHYTPASAKEPISQWLGAEPAYFAQVDGDLGDRLNAATQGAFERGASSVFCIGGDCPALGVSQFEASLEALNKGTDLCFGPTEDGGYYLVGMQSPQPVIFSKIPWSTPQTLAASIDRAEAKGLQVHLLETLYDIDDEADLKRAHQEGLL